MDAFERTKLKMARRSAYSDGEYELDEWEGYTCTECGNRQLSAMAEVGEDLDALLVSYCDECDGELETSDEQTDWERVEEKIADKYITGEAMENDLPECSHCRRDIHDNADATDVDLGAGREYTLHERCAEKIVFNELENPHWYDTFTDAHYWTAALFLQEFETVGHVIANDYLRQLGEIYVHTNYCTSSIVGDLRDHYSARLVHTGIAHEGDEHQHDCTSEHGTCFEILIDFASEDSWRAPPEELHRLFYEEDIYSQDYFVNQQEPAFDADFSGW